MPDATVRLAIYQHFAAHGTAPTRAELAVGCGLDPVEVAAALERLDAARAIVLKPGTHELWMAMPFSAVPTDYRVEWDTGAAFANCAWDAFGIAAALATDVTITTHDPLDRTPLRIEVRGGRVIPDTYAVHFAVPAAQWWADIGFT
jgi:hypothetical protein